MTNIITTIKTKKPVETFIPKSSIIENEAFYNEDRMMAVYEFQSRDYVYILFKDYHPKTKDILLKIGKGPFWRLQTKYHKEFSDVEDVNFYEMFKRQTEYNYTLITNVKPI